MFSINELEVGQTYELKAPLSIDLSIQVGRGGDCGVFLGKCQPETFSRSPLFRVIVNQKNLNKFWKKNKLFEVSNELKEYQVYGDVDIGTENRYTITLRNLDDRKKISLIDFSKLERLAVWETVHILERVQQLRSV